ncbi:MAG: abortive phage infection protein [Clostridiales bacterium]|nr:MAG: abortive phage infection protein [Clostridiales bacterium]
MINAESLKGKIRNISKSNNLSPQEVLQMFFFERFLDRLSRTQYKLNFVIKGGLLIASMLGIDNRTTRDLDTTIKGIPLEKDVIINIVKEIISIDVNDGIHFEIVSVDHIREEDDYENFRMNIIAKYGKINNSMKIDITTGDIITPKDIEYSYSCMFSERDIKIQAYPIETIIAEKYESIIKRNIGTTRMRDFYDLYKLCNYKKDEINYTILSKAIKKTAERRGSVSFINEAKEIIEDIKNDDYLNNLWKVYLKENKYADEISFLDTIEILDFIERVIVV